MAHPSGILVDVVGIESPDRGRSCEEHTVCGAVLELDTVVRFRVEQIDVEGKEQTAIAVYWVSDGIDRCRVGFLRRHLLKHQKDYDGKLAQIVELLALSESPGDRKKHHRNKGACVAVLLSLEDYQSAEAERLRSKKRVSESDEEEDDAYQTPAKALKKKLKK
jgi:hypothetical protein